MSIEEIFDQFGFESTGSVDAGKLQVRTEVRDSCAVDKCQSYGRNWSCPPACGDIEEYQALFEQKTTCYLAQTVAELEDDFDIETMMEAAETNRKRFEKMAPVIHEQFPDALILASGACTLCPKCTYPDAPCRFPQLRLVSMEAAGLVVSDVCTAAGVKYNHGPRTICYTGCVLV